MTDDRPITILCLASEFKGVPFIEECARQGARIILVTAEEAAGKPWPWDSIALHFRMPDLYTQPNITYAVSYLARGNDIDRIVALDDYDVATAASLREHLRLPGLGETKARYFRDKLGMRTQAAANGIRVPAFTSVFNYDQLRNYMAAIEPPWVLKPRFEAGAVGIRKLHDSESVWRALDQLGDQQSYYLLEQFVPGDVYHVDALLWGGEVVFAVSSRYGEPPLSVTQGGGIFNTRLLSRRSEEFEATTGMAADVFRAFGLAQGVTHTEFIRAHHDGQFYFLETAARVGGAHIDRMVEAATGVDLWQEAAHIELAGVRGEAYQVPEHREDYAGLIICLAREQWPNLAAYDDPEIVWRVPREYHAGLLVASYDPDRISELIDGYNERFARDFLMHAPNKKKARTAF
ncbi:MAG: ATP-grasp domain-containing protein [Candidatus Promineofilum sp.]|nr:ATP-grasp domain-containing protein [Promineifilum sp.]MBP9658067.1 ATP-grasp domain-containing protein [Promineifilum sp.]